MDGNQEIVQGKNFCAYSSEVVAVMDTIPFSTAMGMAAMMTGSGTGPRATRVFFTSRAISVEPFWGSSAVSTPTILTGLPLIPPASLISFAARSAPHSRYSPMLAMAPVREFRNGIVHSFGAGCEHPTTEKSSAAASSTPAIFFICPP